jgi:predicted HNH restriction endonuclease
VKGLEGSPGDPDGFTQRVERAKRRMHLYRERKALLAQEAKIRAGFRCEVCRFSFEEFYGVAGRGFAEAHHIESIATARVGTRITPADLVAVCSNCHRMLHRLGGGRQAVRKLRALVKKNADRA